MNIDAGEWGFKVNVKDCKSVTQIPVQDIYSEEDLTAVLFEVVRFLSTIFQLLEQVPTPDVPKSKARMN